MHDLFPASGADTLGPLVAQALIAVSHLLIYFIKQKKAEQK